MQKERNVFSGITALFTDPEKKIIDKFTMCTDCITFQLLLDEETYSNIIVRDIYY
jgi:hypothetical protein